MKRIKEEWNIKVAMERKETFVFRTKETEISDYEIAIRNGKIVSIEKRKGYVYLVLFEEEDRENPKYDERVRNSLYDFAKKDVANFKELYLVLANYDKYYFGLAKQVITKIREEYEKIEKMEN